VRQVVTSVVKRRSVDEIKHTLPKKSFQRTDTETLAPEIQSKTQDLERKSSTDSDPLIETLSQRTDTQTLAPEKIQKPLGLQNPGLNCCFMNSTLQLLRSVKELVDYFISGDASLIYEKKENVDIANDFDVLLRAWDSNFNLKEQHRIFRDKCGTFNNIWNSGEQQDAAHFLMFLLENWI
jgi:ubiquitin C-terminal hydrolase